MACVYQGPPRKRNGLRRWFIDFVDAAGRRRREATDATTKTQAQQLLQARLSENLKAEILGVHSTEGLKPMPFREFFEKEYMPYATTHNRPSTIRCKWQLARHLLPVFGSMLLRAINAGHIEKYMEKRSKATSKPSPAELNRERALLSNALNVAFRRGYVDENPVERIQPFREDNERDLWLTQEEIDFILGHAKEWVKPFILLGVHTGMREGEICGLKREDLEASPGYIRVDKQTSKSHKTRYIPINSVARGVIDAQTRRIGPKGLVPWVLPNPRFLGPYKPTSVSHYFKAAAEAAAREEEKKNHPDRAVRLRKATFHTLRHTFASWLIQAGVPIAEVQGYLGHSSDVMTRRYAHLAKPDKGKRNSLEILVEVGRIPATEISKGKAEVVTS